MDWGEGEIDATRQRRGAAAMREMDGYLWCLLCFGGWACCCPCDNADAVRIC